MSSAAGAGRVRGWSTASTGLASEVASHNLARPAGHGLSLLNTVGSRVFHT